MSGGIVQLVATGLQDVHLTGNPEISFFRSNFKRHTHFAMSTELQLMQGPPNGGGMSSVRFERKGDLLSYVYITARDSTANTVSIDWGSYIDRMDLVIGGQIIDTQDQCFSNTISPLFLSSNYSQRYSPALGTNTFLPLQFWFCKDWQSALPLIALQYHDVELRIYWKSSFPAQSYEFRVWGNFVYLDKGEREWFANNPHDIIMWQMQRQLVSNTSTMDIVFNHPVKFIAMPCQTYTGQTLRMQINGVDIGIDKALIHYSQVYPYYHTQYGYDAQNTGYTGNPVALIPFCLDTAKLQPTGTLNFSRLDTFRLITAPGQSLKNNILNSTATQYLYAVNYNVLRIKAGMAGLMYSN